jgi:hypothetical protein
MTIPTQAKLERVLLLAMSPVHSGSQAEARAILAAVLSALQEAGQPNLERMAHGLAIVVQDAHRLGLSRRGHGEALSTAHRRLDALVQAAWNTAGLPALATIPRPPASRQRRARSPAKRAGNGPGAPAS